MPTDSLSAGIAPIIACPEIVMSDAGAGTRPEPSSAMLRIDDVVKRFGSFTAVGGGAGVLISFDAEYEDSAGIHDVAVNNSRLTVPAGWSRARARRRRCSGSRRA